MRRSKIDEALSNPIHLRSFCFSPSSMTWNYAQYEKKAVHEGALPGVAIFPSGSVHITPEEIENGAFTLKTDRTFSGHTTPEEFENATITGHFRFVFEENTAREITWLSWCHGFQKAHFSDFFPSPLKRKAGVWRAFSKSSVSWRISVDGRPNCSNITAFSNSSGVVQTGPRTFFPPPSEFWTEYPIRTSVNE